VLFVIVSCCDVHQAFSNVTNTLESTTAQVAR
jgi:hypothetical protein